MKYKKISGKQILIRKGDQVSGVYIVTKGQLRVYALTARAKETTLYWINPGESCILSVNCVFSDVLYPAFVENDHSHTEIAIIPSTIFRKLYRSETAVQNFTIDVLSARIFDLMTALEEASTLSLRQRLASLLLKKSNSSKHVVMSQEKMAMHLGSAREVITRNLRQLEELKAIQVSRGYTEIIDTDKLNQVIAGDEI